MTKELHPGLGSGALREALEPEVLALLKRVDEDAKGTRCLTMAEVTMCLNALKRLALSLSSPIEPPPKSCDASHVETEGEAAWQASNKSSPSVQEITEVLQAFIGWHMEEKLCDVSEEECNTCKRAREIMRRLQHDCLTLEGGPSNCAKPEKDCECACYYRGETDERRYQEGLPAQASSEIREALEKLEIYKFGAAADSWKDVEPTEYFRVSDVLGALASRQGAGGSDHICVSCNERMYMACKGLFGCRNLACPSRAKS